MYSSRSPTTYERFYGLCKVKLLKNKVIISDEILEQVNQFTYLGCSISYQCSNDETIQHFNSTHIFIWVRKLDFDSLAETKNWSGWNEIETSGRVHHLRPQS
jgi:predicted transglutaminase-like protease